MPDFLNALFGEFELELNTCFAGKTFCGKSNEYTSVDSYVSNVQTVCNVAYLRPLGMGQGLVRFGMRICSVVCGCLSNVHVWLYLQLQAYLMCVLCTLWKV